MQMLDVGIGELYIGHLLITVSKCMQCVTAYRTMTTTARIPQSLTNCS